MGFLAKLSHQIGDDLARSSVVKAEDVEIYIYGINQILTSVLNISSALIIGLIFGEVLEIAVFMAAYIPLRSFAGGYHAKTPLRCYILSVIMLIIVSICMKHLYIADGVYYVFLAVAALIVIILSPVEDRNKPLDKTEQKIYKRRSMLIMLAEFIIGLFLKMLGFCNLFVPVVYSFAVLSFMLIAGMIKNQFLSTCGIDCDSLD